MQFPFHLSLSQWLELALALGGFIWIGSHTMWVLDPEPVPGLLRHYAVECIALSGGVVLALLMQFHHGKPHVSMLWFCLGMGAVLAFLGLLYFGVVSVLTLAPAWAAGVLATVRMRGNWGYLLWWFWAGVIAQIVLMAVLTAGALMIARMGAALELGPPP
ncbi:MAG: hypothetical protein OXG96_07725 [Acidobacteria bacterium]|nr:hypothetical protein [Acidobacteriota bacterium]